MTLIVSSAASQAGRDDEGGALKAFTDTGLSSHSGLAATLPFLMNYCERNGIEYILHAVPGVGYTIRRVAAAPSYAVKSKPLARRKTLAKKK